MLSFFFFCKQKTAYEMRSSDWSSDVCSSDLLQRQQMTQAALGVVLDGAQALRQAGQIAHAAPSSRCSGSGPLRRRLWPGGTSRSEERRVGKECVSSCRSRCSPNNEKTTTQKGTRRLAPKARTKDTIKN